MEEHDQQPRDEFREWYENLRTLVNTAIGPVVEEHGDDVVVKLYAASAMVWDAWGVVVLERNGAMTEEAQVLLDKVAFLLKSWDVQAAEMRGEKRED